MTQTKFVRMKLSTYRRLRRWYSPIKGESAAQYFERLSKYIERIIAEWGDYDRT